MPFSVMLANSAPADDATITRLTNEGGWTWELKIDGVRCVAAVNKGVTTLTNRNGVDISYRYPEICEALIEKFGPDATLVLDGEAVVFGEDGKPSFKLTSKRDRQQKPAVIKSLSVTLPATLVVFDLLYMDGKDLRDETYERRKALLDVTLQVAPRGRTSHVSNGASVSHADVAQRIQANISSSDGHKMLALVREHGLEGLVAKKLDSPYRAGRRNDWLKVKPVQTISCIVTGCSLGTGARQSTFGALNLELVKDGQRVSVGDVGTGFKQNDLAEIIDAYMDVVRGGPVVRQEFVVEVRFQEMTVDGKLRFPVFVGIRSDITPDECLYEQVVTHQIQELAL